MGTTLCQFLEYFILIFICNHYGVGNIDWTFLVSKMKIDPMPPSPLQFVFRNRVTQVSIQDGVEHGISIAAISTIPAMSSLISAELLPTPAELLPSMRWSAAARSRMRRRRSLRDLLNIVIHSKTSWNTCKILWYIVKHCEPLVKHELLVKQHERLLKHCGTLLKHCETS